MDRCCCPRVQVVCGTAKTPQPSICTYVEKMIGTTRSTSATAHGSLDSWHSRSPSRPLHSISALQKTMRPDVICAIPEPTRLPMSSYNLTACPQSSDFSLGSVATCNSRKRCSVSLLSSCSRFRVSAPLRTEDLVGPSAAARPPSRGRRTLPPAQPSPSASLCCCARGGAASCLCPCPEVSLPSRVPRSLAARTERLFCSR
mmetsp:Transcript_27922/g.65100  ORF Transcript_27922/g.65100 Transcript_27922/m.65100 type:complete len:201 (+) Transcript_27922:62-664(+)